MAHLVANTIIDGVIWEAGCTPPPEVAAKVTNPACWNEPPAGTPMGVDVNAENEHRDGSAPTSDDPTSGPEPDTDEADPVAAAVEEPTAEGFAWLEGGESAPEEP